jgi:amidohydrolase
VWGRVRAGLAHNVIPSAGELSGTLRMLDVAAWHESEQLVRTLIRELVSPYGVTTEVTYVRGVPPVVNSVHASGVLRTAVVDVLGAEGPTAPARAWVARTSRGSWSRSPVRWADSAPVPPAAAPSTCTREPARDERSVAVGAKVLGAAALRALIPAEAD